MQNKAQKQENTPNLQNKQDAGVEHHTQKLTYSKPALVLYGPLAKNITLGFLSGAETDSTFAV